MKKNNFIISCFVCCMMLFSVQGIFAQGTIGEYTGGTATGGFDSGCGYPDAGGVAVGATDATLAGNTCGSAFDVAHNGLVETADGFDITGFTLSNYDIDTEAAYGFRIFYGPQNNCCTICLDAMLDLGQDTPCGNFGPQADLSSFGYPVPANYGEDIFGVDVVPYADMCPNTEYFVQYQFITATAVDLTDPDGNFCAMDDALITNAGTQTAVSTIVAPGTRDPIVINSTTLTAAAAADCGAIDVLLDFTADITAGCTVSFGTCSQGLEFEFRAALACADGTTLDITTGPLLDDPMACFTGAAFGAQISLGSAADVCAILACDPAASLELYATYTFCEADDIVGDGSGNDEAVMSVSIASILADFDAAMCCNVVAACPEFNAQTYGPICNGYDICIGYIDTDQDGIGDAGEDPTGIMMTVADGLATSTAQAPINDGVFFFDADGDGVTDAVGYCYTVLYDNPTCDPEPYTPLVTMTCADGTPGMLLGGTPLTDYDILATAFGIPGGTAIYPPLVGIITAPVCPTLPDGSDAVAGNVEVFVADAAGNPTATSCLVVPGPAPACDSDNTADPAANAIPVQWNPTNDPLFTALAGADSYSCGLNAVADLSIACPACDVMAVCPEFNAQTYGPICNGYDICIGYIDTDQDGIGDAGEDPTGIMMTVADGLATSTAQAPINDGVFFFDADGDGVTDAVGYCYTVLYDNPTCDPEPYTPLVTMTCADGTPGMLLGGTPITDFDILANTFGIPGGTAIYPPLVGVITAPVCPMLPDGSDAVAGNVEVFVADAAGDPTATSCLVVPGPAPACDSDNTADPAANAVPVQWNPTNDPLFTALAGPDSYSCGLNATADLSIACPICEPTACTVMLTAPPAATGCDPNDGVGFPAPLDLAACMGADGPVGTGLVYDIYLYAPGGVVAEAPVGYENTPIPAAAEYPDPFADGNLVDFGAVDLTCADAVGTIGLLNPTCDDAVFTFIYVPFDYALDTDGDLVAEYPQDCQPVRVDYTVSPTLTAMIDADNSATCGTVTASLYDAGGVMCAGTEMTVSCTNDGDPTDITLTDNGCGPYTISGGACAGCVVVCEDEISGMVVPPAGCDVSGITVTIYDSAGNVVTTLTTDASGVYDSTPAVYPCGDYTAELTANLPACYTDANGETGPKPFTIDDDPDNNDTDGTDFEPAPLVCSISATVTSMCEDTNGTPEDGSDDITTYTITVTGTDTGAGFTASVAPDTGTLTYGTPLTYTVIGEGGLSVTFTDDTDITCTTSVNQSSGCAVVENIPTVGEWGLIILGLLMSITAVVGIRQRREEEATA